MKTFSSLPLAVLVLMSLTSACGMIKNMSEMHDSTQKMADTTSKMSNTTDGMAATTKEMAGTTDGMATTTNGMAKTTNRVADIAGNTYADLRIGNSRDGRQNAMAAMIATDDQAAKLGYSSEYFAGMEYQFWKPGQEDAAGRLDLQNVAVMEFFRKIKQFINSRENFDPTVNDGTSKSLFAMAATLHYVNLAQTNALKNAPAGTKVVTMLSMIEDGLKAKADVNAGRKTEEDLPQYQAEVLRNEQDAIYILRIRQNFLKAMTFDLAAGTEMGDDPTHNRAMGDYFRDMLHLTWKPDFDSRNALQINFMAGALQFAAESAAFLKSIGEDPETNGKVIVLLRGLNITNLTDVSRTEPAKAKAIANFSQALTAALTQ
jgi:hypothetical protein